MASVVLTVRVKTQKPNTPDGEAQPKKSAGDEKTEEAFEFYDWAKHSMTAKAIKQVGKNTVGYVGSHISVWTGNSYYGSVYQGISNMAGMAKGIAANPVLGSVSAITSLVTYLIDREFNLKWENRNAEQAARRSGNYLTGNSR